MNTSNFKKRKIIISIDGIGFTTDELRQYKEEIDNIFKSSYGKTFRGIAVDDRGAKSEKPLTIISVIDYIDIDHLGYVCYSDMKKWENKIKETLSLDDSVVIDIMYDYEQYDEQTGQSLLECFVTENRGWLPRKYNV